MTLHSISSAVLLTAAIVFAGQDGTDVSDAQTASRLLVSSLRHLSDLFPCPIHPIESTLMVTAGFRG
ncbi:MAG: hypothetical protein EPO20_05045 [Betaproteobacteria bacterium]|nr:MAG: hypothetical protein EPO20_05045 [Betaproteobacteria bacterium]